ncbi:STAS domain-containing protein [Evansella clarkii]|jgi:anti-anti-sigma regulatory factor|uniref:STAS domain-containing protein n=1 Tax=Evansella clarkii TaxID=79879 RepID=UPI000997B21A|nr:STAS domain-containing protein [Evansella clarkii]
MNTKHEINVAGLDFGWDVEEGKFLYEGEDAVLFWISSAMKVFFDTIEEVSGEDATQVVLETTGFRQGLIVGEYFHNLKNVSVEEACDLITNTYATAGWGLAKIKNFNWENKTFQLQLKDDWEYKINVSQEKDKGGNFLPAHYAGIFTGLFGENIAYKVKQYQIEGHDNTIVEYFPSDSTITENIHEFARQKEADQIKKLEELVEQKTNELQELVKTLSSPMIPVMEGIVVVPLLGKYDEKRSEELIDKVLEGVPKQRARYLLLDLTGLAQDITIHTAATIEKLGMAASLTGTKTVLVGISAELSMIMAKKNIQFSRFECFQSLEHGVYHALAESGKRIV